MSKGKVFSFKDIKKFKAIDLIFIALIFAWAFFINNNMRMMGLYDPDDLREWVAYSYYSFPDFCFPEWGLNYRPVFWMIEYLEFIIAGSHFGRIIKINILMLSCIASVCYLYMKNLSGSRVVSFFLSGAIVASRFSYYAIGTLFGSMEMMAMFFAIAISICLFVFMQNGKKQYYYLGVLAYLLVVFTHERYLVLLPMFYYVLIMSSDKHVWRYVTPAGVFILNLFVRMKFTGKAVPSGAGGTNVAETYHFGDGIKNFVSQLKYLAGINDGPQHLNGREWVNVSEKFKLLVYAGIMFMAIIAAVFLIKIIIEAIKGESRNSRLALRDIVFFMGFIIGCIACSSLTFRVEIRWIYVSFCFMCFCFAYMFGYIRRGSQILEIVAGALVVILSLIMINENWVYRADWKNLYCFERREAVNSLCDETYWKYKEDVFDKQVYIIGNEFALPEMYDEYYIKSFDATRQYRGCEIIHVNSIDEIPKIDENTIVLAEDTVNRIYVPIELR